MTTLILTRRVGEKFYVTLPDGTVVEVMIWGARKVARLEPGQQPSDFDGVVKMKFDTIAGKGVDIGSKESAVGGASKEEERQATLKTLRALDRQKQRRKNEKTHRK